jgi:transposase
VLKDISKMEQRYDAVLGVLRVEFAVAEVVQKFNVSRQNVHAWLARYEAGGLEVPGEQSSCQETSPKQIEGRIEARVAELCRHHPSRDPVVCAIDHSAKASVACR